MRKLTKSYSDPELKLVLKTEKTNHRKVQSSLQGIDESVEIKTRKLVITNTRVAQINLPRPFNETPVVNNHAIMMKNRKSRQQNMVPAVSTKTLPQLKPTLNPISQSPSMLNLGSQLKNQDFSNNSKETPAKSKAKVPPKLLFTGSSQVNKGETGLKSVKKIKYL